MGILDEAIRDHLELKRKGGAQENDLKRLEDEAFGPPSRPGDVAAVVAAPAEAPEALKREPSPPGDGEEVQGIGEQQAASPDAAPVEGTGEEPSTAPDLGGIFHDFAAEEGLVSSSPEAPAAPAEPDVAPQPEDRPEEPASEEPAGEGAAPAEEASLDDTQPHDMQAELGSAEESTPTPEEPSPPTSGDLELPDEDLELRLDDDDEQRPSGDLRVVEEEDEEVVVEDVEVEEVADDEGDDVLEETPDFLRETPEHDRLWFEQRPPKDFDFDE